MKKGGPEMLTYGWAVVSLLYVVNTGWDKLMKLGTYITGVIIIYMLLKREERHEANQ